MGRTVKQVNGSKKDAIKSLCEHLEGRMITLVEVDDESGMICLRLDSGRLELSGDRVSAMYYSTEANKLH